MLVVASPVAAVVDVVPRKCVEGESGKQPQIPGEAKISVPLAEPQWHKRTMSTGLLQPAHVIQPDVH